MAKKKKQAGGKKGRPFSLKDETLLRRASILLRRGEWAEAGKILEDLDRRYPRQKPILALLVDVYYRLSDFPGYLSAAQRLLPLVPNDPEIHLMLAAAYLANSLPALSLRTFRHVLERWPDHVRAADVRKTVAELEPSVPDSVREAGVSGPEAFELAVQHEEVQSLLAQGKEKEVQQAAERLLQRWPRFAPALNNSSETYYREGRLADAVATARRVLEFDPENFHALANLTRYLCLSGRLDEARAMAERLKKVASPRGDLWVKKAEALSYLGDDQGVLDAWHGAGQAGEEGPPLQEALLRHLAAVALYRQGQEDEARRLWQEALRRMPGLDMAKANLSDLRRPVGQRHAAWPFPFRYWVPERTVRDLSAQVARPARGRSEEKVAQAVRLFLETHPEARALVPPLLDRGDEAGRLFALHLARMVRTPEMLAALRDFALGQRGPDQLRVEAAQAASQAGLLSPGPVRMWINGQWTELLMIGFEIHHDQGHSHSPQVNELDIETIALQRRGEHARAEQLLRQALEIEPGARDLLLNLCLSLEAQGRRQEADDLMRQIHQEHPDYFFGNTGMARLYIREGQLDKARALLDPLLTRKRMHFSELNALCIAEIELGLARGNPDTARSWLEMLQRGDPDNLNLPELRRRVREATRQGR